MRIATLAAFLLIVLAGFPGQAALAQTYNTQALQKEVEPGLPESRIVKERDSLQPYINNPEQAKEAAKKLEALEKKYKKKPNIVIILADDMGWGDAGCYGGGEAVGAPTPNLDRMAAEGLRLTSVYSQPTCTPTRVTIMTGRLNIRHGVYRPPMYGEKGGLEGEVVLAKLLSDAGYTTCAVGKWHMGENEPNQPQNVGFDEWFGFLGVCNIYTEWRDPYFNPEIANDPALTKAFEKAPFNKNLVKAKKGEKLQNLKEITIPVLANIDQDFLKYSVDFIKRQKDSKKPFFLYHCLSRVHFDNYPAEGYRGKSPAKYPYKDGIVELDDIVGKLLATLKDTGQAENTFVFFTSDNGVEEDTWPDSGYAPWRGSKGTTWEGATRVPGLAWWPGMIKPSRVSDGLFDLSDLFNTSLALADARKKIPTDRYIDGIDQTSFLLADTGMTNRAAVYFWNSGKLSAFRWREFKFYASTVNIGHGRYDAVGGMNYGAWEEPIVGYLYNLYIDPRERKPIMIRKTWMAPIISKIMNNHLETFKKYPAKEAAVKMPSELK